MKIGNVEGDPEEIRNFFESYNINIEDYFEWPRPSLKLVWLIVPICFVFVVLVWLTLFAPTSIGFKILIFLIGCLSGVWLGISVLMRFQSKMAATFVIGGVVLAQLFAFGALSAAELLKLIKDLIN